MKTLCGAMAVATLSGLFVLSACSERAASSSASLPDARSAPWPQPATTLSDDTVIQEDPGQMQADAPYAPGHLLVKMRPNTSNGATTGPAPASRMQALLGNRAKLKSERLIGSDRAPARGAGALATGIRRLVVETAPGADLRKLAQEVQANPDVEWAEPDYFRHTQTVTPNDPNFSNEWHIAAIGADKAWDTTTGRGDVIVAIIDTGVDWNHPDLRASIWRNADEIEGDGIDNDGNGYVDDVRGWDFVTATADEVDSGEDPGPSDNDPSDVVGHGTLVSGVACGDGNNGIGFAGVSWKCAIMPLRAGYKNKNGEGEFKTSDVIEAIRYAADNGARIVNMSLGGTELSHAEREAIDYATSKGLLIVAAAGNSKQSTLSYPAAHADVLAVAALASGNTRSIYSNYGLWVDLAAPGDEIYGPFPGDQYVYASGTSLAAPIVTGVAALVAAAHPTWIGSELAYQLVATARNVDDSNYSAYKGTLGAGIVNAEAAVGSRTTAPSMRLLSASWQETTGDNDGEYESGEAITLLATVKGLADAASGTLRFMSGDPFVTIPTTVVDTGPVGLEETKTIRFDVQIGPDAPADHLASFVLFLQNDAVSNAWPLKTTLSPTWRKPERLPRSFAPVMLPRPDGGLTIVLDDSTELDRHRIISTFMDPTGRFSPWFELTDSRYPYSELPAAYAAPNGDLHVVYCRYVDGDQHMNPQVFYRGYAAAAGAWSPEEQITSDAALAWFVQVAPEVTIDPEGRPHVIWFDIKEGAARIYDAIREVDGWRTQLLADLPQGEIWAEMTLIHHGEGSLSMFFQHDFGPTQMAPFYVSDWNGRTWETPRLVNGLDGTISGLRPFAFGGAVYRAFRPAENWAVHLARYDGSQWLSVRPIVDELIGYLNDNIFVGIDPSGNPAMTASPVLLDTSNPTLGTMLTDYVWQGDGLVQRAVPTDELYDARDPLTTFDGAGNHHILASETFPVYFPGIVLLVNTYEGYYTQAPRPSSVIPTRPAVVDEGEATTNPSALRARWSSSGPSGIAYYEMAVGTAPGQDDLEPWSRTTFAEGTLDLVDRPMQMGPTYYLSVRSVSPEVYGSTVGWSDGIKLSAPPRCTSRPWESATLYEDAGILVTHEGAAYRNRYWNQGQRPNTSQYGPWERVGVCRGEAPVLSCVGDPWDGTRVYTGGELVAHRGHMWQAKWYNSRSEPGTSNGPWKSLAPCR